MELETARVLATDLMARHGLDGWSFRFDRARRRAGACRFGERAITLSAPLTRLYEDTQVREVILHEIAHALTGPRHGHDDVWRAQVEAIGGRGLAHVPPAAPRVRGPWVGRCPAGHEIDRFRRPTRVLACTRCARRFSLDAVFTWTFRGVAADPGGRYRRELAALERAARAR